MNFKKIITLFLISISIFLSYNNILFANETREERIARLYKDIPMDSRHINYLVNLSYNYNIDPDLVLSIIWCESNFNPLAKNKNSTASGYSQMIKSTALYCVKNIDSIKEYNHKIHAFDPYINLQLMIYYIDRCFYEANDNLDKALLMYRGCNDIAYFKKVKANMNRIKANKIRGDL